MATLMDFVTLVRASHFWIHMRGGDQEALGDARRWRPNSYQVRVNPKSRTSPH